ncbi:flagellar hook-length control protein FliK [Priestia endophytica]|uniref:flagellar hook-length control protein FliK n=1 Tax=Priestia endophytica TaxID=135735 RepID=UPI00227E9B3B|nr:flagellar hook-length control protein FliK [Priestia endophytica]MCY8231852.1 flagellar hook-length control protein FliK [Priestia endophytica]
MKLTTSEIVQLHSLKTSLEKEQKMASPLFQGLLLQAGIEQEQQSQQIEEKESINDDNIAASEDLISLLFYQHITSESSEDNPLESRVQKLEKIFTEKSGLDNLFPIDEKGTGKEIQEMLQIVQILQKELIQGNAHDAELVFLMQKSPLFADMKETLTNDEMRALKVFSKLLEVVPTNVKDEILKGSSKLPSREELERMLSHIDQKLTTLSQRKEFSSPFASFPFPSFKRGEEGKGMLDTQHNFLSTIPSGTMSKVHQLVFYIGNNGSSQEDGLVRQLQQAFQRSSLFVHGNQTKLLIKLHPQELGTITVQLVKQQNKLTATIVTSTSATKEMLEHHLHHLKSALTHQGVQVEKMEVLQQFSAAEGSDAELKRDSPDEEEKQKEQQSKEQKEENRFEDILKELEMIEEM